MKKLMIMACAVGLAAVAQAGVAKWTATKLTASPSGAIVAGSTTYAGYIFEGSNLDEITAYLTSATPDLTSFKEAAVSASPFTATASSASAISFSNAEIGDYTSAGDVSLFAIIVDASDVSAAKYFQVAKANGTGDAVLTKNFGATGNQSYVWGSQTSNTAWTKITNVPEPTSAMLMLLGMAGLALRRRRA